MRRALAFAVFLIAACAYGDRVLLIPLDSRPAAGQFAQMIARMASVDVEMPPSEMLGRFTTEGKPEEILDWLRKQDFKDVIGVVASTDMVAFGGLIPSRVMDVTFDEAAERMRAFAAIRQEHKDTPFYGFSAIMRLTPTATKAAAAWRLQLARYEEMKDRYRRLKDPKFLKTMQDMQAKTPALEIQRYELTRARNHQLQAMLLEQTRDGVFDYLILGQDDAKPYGPHIPEQEKLRILIAKYAVPTKVYMCEGIDQHGNVLVSRALLRHAGWVPKIRVVYSDNAGRGKVANYESKIIALSLADQLLASGAAPVFSTSEYDFSLYLNVPSPRKREFDEFIGSLKEDVDQGFPVAVADINLAQDGTGDARLFAALSENGRLMKLLSYAGWNTAGNTMGTAIPTANVYLLARKLGTDALRREIAQREFLLHRLVNDFAYHKFTRPYAYRMIDSMPKASRAETYGDEFDQVNQFASKDLGVRLDQYFRDQFLGKRFFAGTTQYEILGLEDKRIFLPWPRAFEVQLEFKMKATPVPGG